MNAGMARKRGTKLIVILSIVAVFVVALGVFGYRMAMQPAKIDAAQIATVDRGDIARSVVATGKVQPISKVEVKSKASGIVEKLSTDINQTVHKGQILAQLDEVEIQAQVEAARAQLAGAESNERSCQAAIALDRVNAESPDLPMIRHTYERTAAMSRDGVMSAQMLDDSHQKYVIAINTRDRAMAQITIDEAKLKQAQSQVAQSRASLRQLEEQLSYTTITSPMDGVVLSRDVEVGNAVSSILVMGSTATLVMTLGDISQVYVQGKVDESDIGHIYLGQPARIRVESFKDKTFSGKVTKIAPLGIEKDNVTTFEVRVSIDNPGGDLKANMTANAEVLLEEHKNVLSVPEQAVIYDKARNATIEVPSKDDNTGRKKMPVKVGLSNGVRTEIISGLKAGDRVLLQQ